MLPKRLRLSRKTFPGADGRRMTSEHFSLTVSLRNGGCAVVVSKKVARKSVDRHLLKRRMLAILKEYCSESHSLVLYARQGAPTLPFKALKEEVLNLLSRAMTVA